MITVNIIGSGNVAWHLLHQIEKAEGVTLKYWCSRSEKPKAQFEFVQHKHTNIKAIKPAQLTIIAVSDTAIEPVSMSLPFSGELVAHTSGSIAIDVIDAKHRSAVFYPLQTFTKGIPLDFSALPLCLETTNQEDYLILEKVASALSESVHHIDTTQRKQLHLAAVFANNFTNHCYTLASELCAEQDLQFDLLHQLIRETAQKAMTISPELAQTGPAKRGDLQVLENQKACLPSEELKDLYQTLSQSIQKYYGKKL